MPTEDKPTEGSESAAKRRAVSTKQQWDNLVETYKNRIHGFQHDEAVKEWKNTPKTTHRRLVRLFHAVEFSLPSQVDLELDVTRDEVDKMHDLLSELAGACYDLLENTSWVGFDNESEEEKQKQLTELREGWLHLKPQILKEISALID